MKRPFIHRRFTIPVVTALVATALIPGPAFACWYTCTAKYGYRRQVDGEYYHLVSCSQTWPDGANGPITNCVYAPGYWE